MDLAEDQKYLSPLELSKAKFRDARTGRQPRCSNGPNGLINHKQQRKSILDQKVLELADAYWTYQNLRAGKGLNLIPVKGGEHEQSEQSAEQLLQSKFDNSIDAAGSMHKAQTFQKAKAAFRTGRQRFQ